MFGEVPCRSPKSTHSFLVFSFTSPVAKTHQTRPLFASFQHPAIGRQSAQQLSRVFESTQLALKMSGAGADWPLSELEQQRLRPVVPCMQGALTDFARGARTWSG